ncbi:hypothetical protein AB3U99_20185 [Niallia sp. JL1B1071]|uniref:hypothetical protein n=1 Tax=Niallia tiangongensis TaxID=3237105 RepID=UPI0037DC9D80
MNQENNDELLIKQSLIVKEYSAPIPETPGNIGKGLFFGIFISIPLWFSFFGLLRICFSLIDKYI